MKEMREDFYHLEVLQYCSGTEPKH